MRDGIIYGVLSYLTVYDGGRYTPEGCLAIVLSNHRLHSILRAELTKFSSLFLAGRLSAK